jgi:hypothetical protein
MADDEADPRFERLIGFLRRIPAIEDGIGCGAFDDQRWWVKFSIDIEHALAWQVVQELGHVLNYVSLDERLPTLFMPVSPPPYMNGGPRAYLAWVIETKDLEFTPDQTAEWLESRLPHPVDDPTHWSRGDDDD